MVTVAKGHFAVTINMPVLVMGQKGVAEERGGVEEGGGRRSNEKTEPSPSGEEQYEIKDIVRQRVMDKSGTLFEDLKADLKQHYPPMDSFEV